MKNKKTATNPFYTIMHPFDASYDIRYKEKGNLYFSLIILLVFFLVSVFERQSTGYIFNNNKLSDLNAPLKFVGVVLPFVLFVIANWVVSILFNGTGRFRDIWIYSAYCCVPYIIGDFVSVLLSNVLVMEEPFGEYVQIFGAAWSLIILFIGLISFLNSSTNSSKEDEMDWEPEKKTYDEGWEMAAENNSFALYFEPSLMQLSLKDKRQGMEWKSNPENAQNDPIAFGQNKTAVRSLLTITYVDDQSSYFTINSFAACVQEGTYTYGYADDGVYVNLQFAKQGFEIPCFFGIKEDRFIARVLSDQIVQHGSLLVAEISLLPYFGAGSLEDNGYMFVPDGCGALIYYNNQKGVSVLSPACLRQ